MSQTENNEPNPEPPPLLNFDEAATYLKSKHGIDVKPRTIRKWHQEAAIATFKRGSIIGIPPASLDDFVVANTRKGHPGNKRH